MPFRIFPGAPVALASLVYPAIAREPHQPDTADPSRRADTGFSVDRLAPKVARRSDIENVHQRMGRIPATQVTQFDHGATNGKFSFRAFNGAGTINAVELLIDAGAL